MSEGHKEFYLTIAQSSSLNGVIIGSLHRAVVELYDNECKQINCYYVCQWYVWIMIDSIANA